MASVEPASLLRELRADAARRSGVPESSTVVESSEPVTWRDSSLGCPEPDRLYMQALVPGWRIRIEAGGTRHDYHASRRGQWVWCPPGRAVDPAPGNPRV